MPDDLVSVVICVRNGEKYLADALDSIAAQGLKSPQVIVVDDGSTDSSCRIAANHPLKPEILSQKPLGFSFAFNLGLSMAKGQWLAFVDCDDIWPPQRCKLMMAALKKNPGVDFVCGQVMNTDAELNPVAKPVASRLAGASLFRREAAARVGELRTDLVHGAFIDWCSRAALAGLKVLVLEEVVLLRRIHGDNVGGRDRLRARADLLRVVRDHLKRSH